MSKTTETATCARSARGCTAGLLSGWVELGSGAVELAGASDVDGAADVAGAPDSGAGSAAAGPANPPVSTAAVASVANQRALTILFTNSHP
ncbi:hypothetical protein H480_10900 [Amycolatopsis vancoresmycina DSM 44592]|uniref:Uncharacterized protein n=1 Tax=Amycolatopsis vancoresmycina DSM 44592 TaxID=1292037 RepID=R1IDQ3_9PSEU|nr:hypothetical protein H480_10900 [Amycolatopsis vancoresmycina DSM 44592]